MMVYGILSKDDPFKYKKIINEKNLKNYSLTSINYILNKANMKIIDIEFNDINGGSIAVYVLLKLLQILKYQNIQSLF